LDKKVVNHSLHQVDSLQAKVNKQYISDSDSNLA
jgi:hypothetical protein